jgi:hypothetical protein
MRRPNTLVIMADEHDPAVAGPYDNALARTPNLDRLAGAGVTLAGAYCTSGMWWLVGRGSYPAVVASRDGKRVCERPDPGGTGCAGDTCSP